MTSSVSTFEYCDWLTIAAPSFVTYLSFSRNWNYKESQCWEKWYFVFNWEIWAVSVYKQQGSPLRWRSPGQNILEQWFQFHTIWIIESILHQHCFLDRKCGSEEDFVFWIIERERLGQSAILLTLNTWPDKTCCNNFFTFIILEECAFALQMIGIWKQLSCTAPTITFIHYSEGEVIKVFKQYLTNQTFKI